MVDAITQVGDCLDYMSSMEPGSVDLVYADPPFFTQQEHKHVLADGTTSYAFRDIWDSQEAYLDYLYQRITYAHQALKNTGSLFLHCDKSASHILRLMLDRVFGTENFRSEIIWSYRRWSNGRKGLLPGHQTIFFYSKSSHFKFNTLHQEYSPATNIDQVMQKRVRDFRNKVVYRRDAKGQIEGAGAKKGVPLSDVWDIPLLNPKSRERVGYPTQKPVLLLQRIIQMATDEGDWVLDPFCGCGTTLIAATLLRRNSIGIDISNEAVALARQRLEQPVFSNSALLQNGRDSFRQHDTEAACHLFGIDYTPVHRNRGIDGLLKTEANGLPVFIRVQRKYESLDQSAAALKKAALNKGDCKLVVVATHNDFLPSQVHENVAIIPSTVLALHKYMSNEN